MPFYRAIAAAIRQEDARHIISYEAVMWDLWPVGFDGSLGTPEREALSWHAYCWFAPNVSPEARPRPISPDLARSPRQLARLCTFLD